LDETVNGSGQTFQMSQFRSCTGVLEGGSFNVFSSPPSAGGPMTVREATANAVAPAFMNMATQLSMCDIMRRAADLGVVRANPKNDDGTPAGVPVPFQDAYPANVVGTDNTAALPMAGAYAAFAAGGVYCTPIAITSVVDTSGRGLPVPSAGCRQAVDPQVASQVTLALSDVWAGPMKAVDHQVPSAAGMTGTSNDNEYTWFIGYTPQLAAAAVVSGSLTGFVSANNKTIGAKRYGVVYGPTIAGVTWSRFMTRALAVEPGRG